MDEEEIGFRGIRSKRKSILKVRLIIEGRVKKLMSFIYDILTWEKYLIMLTGINCSNDKDLFEI